MLLVQKEIVVQVAVMDSIWISKDFVRVVNYNANFAVTYWVVIHVQLGKSLNLIKIVLVHALMVNMLIQIRYVRTVCKLARHVLMELHVLHVLMVISLIITNV